MVWSLEGIGESLGGIFDTVVDGGQSLINAWVDDQTHSVGSAAPEENRQPPPPETVEGRPIVGGYTDMLPIYIMGGVIIAGLGFLAFKK